MLSQLLNSLSKFSAKYFIKKLLRCNHLYEALCTKKRSPTIPKNSGTVLPENGARFLFCPCPLVAARCNYSFGEPGSTLVSRLLLGGEKNSSEISCMKGVTNCFSSSTGTSMAFAIFSNPCMKYLINLMPISACRSGSIRSSFQGTNLLRHLRSEGYQIHSDNALSIAENYLPVNVTPRRR